MERMANEESAQNINDDATAMFWRAGALVSCPAGDETSTKKCCNDTWLLLQRVCTSSNEWCLENRDDFDSRCLKQMTSFVPNDEGTDDRWHSFFLSPESKKREENQSHMLEWNQFVNGAWKEGPIVPMFRTDISPSEEPTFSASIHSRLSADGGMHRLLHHNITVQCPKEVKQGSPYRASITMLVFVTQHFFVDVDDAFAFSSPHENVEPSLLSSRERIDIEQPSFVSPQHVMVIKVVVNGTCGDTHSFATKLHVRYPQLTQSGHLQVIFPAPLLYSGMLVTSQQEYSLNASNDFVWQPPIAHEVATGFEGDYILVGLVTLLSSIIGSLVLLQSMSKVSKWN